MQISSPPLVGPDTRPLHPLSWLALLAAPLSLVLCLGNLAHPIVAGAIGVALGLSALVAGGVGDAMRRRGAPLRRWHLAVGIFVGFIGLLFGIAFLTVGIVIATHGYRRPSTGNSVSCD